MQLYDHVCFVVCGWYFLLDVLYWCGWCVVFDQLCL